MAPVTVVVGGSGVVGVEGCDVGAAVEGGAGGAAPGTHWE